MSYKIGQFRQDTLQGGQAYLTEVTLLQSDRITEASSVERIYFKDIKFNIKDSSSFSRNINYYVKIEIERPNTIIDENTNKKQNSNQEFLLFLENESQSQQTSQFLKNFYVPSITSENQTATCVTLELIFNPSLAFSNLVLQMKRTGVDYLIQPDETDQSLYGRVARVTSIKCYIINNILSTIAAQNQQSSSIEFVKMGIQGPSGMLMCINGEEIRIWPNGIYQVKNGYKISFLGFIIEDNTDTKNSFILDYQY